MDLRPIITCAGDKVLYERLNADLERKLPETATEWRRSYGRPIKSVRLTAQFINIKDTVLHSNIETASSLHKQPFFHLFWTECQDGDEYKFSLKEKISEWQRKLKDKGIVDWLIIHVSQENLKNKPKFTVPRSSVFDKIKSDFGGKNSDRIIQLWEPLKEGQIPRSGESWSALVTKLRQLLLMSFNRHLGKFEDRVRALRERRTEPRWSFTTYFLLHEELAFVFEMMKLYDEALIQYDEIDALLTQLIINSQFGEPLQCLDVFMRDCQNCDGVPLTYNSQQLLRNFVKSHDATFLDLRNYLCARQCNLLILLEKPWEIAQRSLDFVHNLAHELNILKISMPVGGPSCCMILTCLEVLRACHRHCDPEDVNYSLQVALLYQHARHKLDDVGKFCGLMPGTTPTEKELQNVCLLLRSIGRTQDEQDKRVSDSPVRRLHEALSSKHTFENLYLELTELSIKIYKNIGRRRSAKRLETDLAQFYINREEYDKAEPLLSDAYKIYKHEKWLQLATQTLVTLALCQERLGLNDRYASSCCTLACEKSLSHEKRLHYAQALIQLIRDTIDSDSPLVIRAEPLFQVEGVDIKLQKGIRIGSIGECITVELKLMSNLEEEVTCRRISFSLQTSDTIRRNNNLFSSKGSSLNRSASPLPLLGDESLSSTPVMSEEDLSEKPEEDQVTGSDTVSAEDIFLEERTSHPVRHTPSAEQQLLERSTDELNIVADISMAENCVECVNVPLKYGENIYHLTVQVAEEGQYYLKQLCVEIGQLHFIWPELSLSKSESGFGIVADPPKIVWKQEDKDLELLAGIPQQIGLCVSVGPGSIAEGSVLEISSRTGLCFLPVEPSTATIHSTFDVEEPSTEGTFKIIVPEHHAEKCNDEAPYSVALVTLPACRPYEEISLYVVVSAPLGKQSVQDELTKHQVCFCCKWLNPSYSCDLYCSFSRPFTIRHVLHSSANNQFVQVFVKGTTQTDLDITAPELVAPNCPALKARAVHKSLNYIIKHKQEMSFLWKLEASPGSLSYPDCEFRTSFNLKDSPATENMYVYDFQVENTQTLFTVQSKMEPSEDGKDLIVGSLCNLCITFTNTCHVGQQSETECPHHPFHHNLLYEVEVESNTWMISGRNKGVISIPDVAMATCKVTLNVMPLTGGYLPLPDVKLSKYDNCCETDRETDRETNRETDIETSDSENKDSEKETNQERETTENKSVKTHSTRAPPVITPFLKGQVYNRTKAAQVKVLPSN